MKYRTIVVDPPWEYPEGFAVLVCMFGAYGQVVVGSLLVLATTVQTWYWLVVTPPTVRAVFIVSMEALYFAAYANVATGLAVLWLNKRTPGAA